jgi:hypothetical protein
VFDREAAVRHRTRRLLTGLAQGATDPPPLGLEDCPSYWLQPAAEALSALMRDDEVAAEKFAAGERGRWRQAREAAEYDKERLARQAGEIADALKKCQSRQKDLAAGAAADRDAILTLLA